MTVAELIEMLSKMTADLLIVIPGYENGYDPVFEIAQLGLVPQAKLHRWDGVLDTTGIDVKPRKCVVIGQRHVDDDGKMLARLTAADIEAECDDDRALYLPSGWSGHAQL